MFTRLLLAVPLCVGLSITAVGRGRSVETSMGLSPLEGLVMGTRSGDVDPAVVGHVAAASGRSEAEVLDDLNRSSGLLGLCGDSDMRAITARIDAGDEVADLALDVFCHRIRKYVGAYVAVLGGCDALVFTAGIGEHDPITREMCCQGLESFGLVLDREKNQTGRGQARVISKPDSPVRIVVIPTNEELEIARQTVEVLDSKGFP